MPLEQVKSIPHCYWTTLEQEPHSGIVSIAHPYQGRQADRVVLTMVGYSGLDIVLVLTIRSLSRTLMAGLTFSLELKSMWATGRSSYEPYANSEVTRALTSRDAFEALTGMAQKSQKRSSMNARRIEFSEDVLSAVRVDMLYRVRPLVSGWNSGWKSKRRQISCCSAENDSFPTQNITFRYSDPPRSACTL